MEYKKIKDLVPGMRQNLYGVITDLSMHVGTDSLFIILTDETGTITVQVADESFVCIERVQKFDVMRLHRVMVTGTQSTPLHKRNVYFKKGICGAASVVWGPENKVGSPRHISSKTFSLSKSDTNRLKELRILSKHLKDLHAENPANLIVPNGHRMPGGLHMTTPLRLEAVNRVQANVANTNTPSVSATNDIATAPSTTSNYVVLSDSDDDLDSVQPSRLPPCRVPTTNTDENRHAESDSMNVEPFFLPFDSDEELKERMEYLARSTVTEKSGKVEAASSARRTANKRSLAIHLGTPPNNTDDQQGETHIDGEELSNLAATPHKRLKRKRRRRRRGFTEN